MHRLSLVYSVVNDFFAAGSNTEGVYCGLEPFLSFLPFIKKLSAADAR